MNVTKEFTGRQWFDAIAKEDVSLAYSILTRIKNYCDGFDLDYSNATYHDFEDFIASKFRWDDTPEGAEYWNDVCKEYANLKVEQEPT